MRRAGVDPEIKVILMVESVERKGTELGKKPLLYSRHWCLWKEDIFVLPVRLITETKNTKDQA